MRDNSPPPSPPPRPFQTNPVAGCSDDAAVSGGPGLETSELSKGELFHAAVAAVIHIVAEAVDPTP